MVTGAWTYGQMQGFIRSAVYRGLSANSALNIAKGVGEGIRRTDFLDRYRLEVGNLQKAELLKYVRKEYRPSQNLHIPNSGFMSQNFRYTTKFTVRNRLTGEISTQFTNTTSQNVMTRGETERLSIDAVSEGYDRSNYDILDYELVGATVRDTFTW